MRNQVRSRLLSYIAVCAASGFAIGGSGVNATAKSAPASQMAQDSKSPEDVIKSWPAAKQAAYELWPAETKAYYWTLSPERQKVFWSLADTDKVALSGMSAPERAQAWERIEKRSGAPKASG